MTRNDLINRLTALPDAIRDAEEALHRTTEAETRAENNLTVAKAVLISEGKVSTAPIKVSGELHLLTLPEQEKVTEAKAERRKAEAALAFQRNTLAALRSVAALLATDPQA